MERKLDRENVLKSVKNPGKISDNISLHFTGSFWWFLCFESVRLQWEYVWKLRGAENKGKKVLKCFEFGKMIDQQPASGFPFCKVQV